jgi:hypothetical protein
LELKINALLSGIFHIPFPERLSATARVQKWRQLQWFLAYEAEKENSNGTIEL